MVENHISNFQPIAAKELSVLHILSVFYLEGEANVPITDLKTLSYFVIHSKKAHYGQGPYRWAQGLRRVPVGRGRYFFTWGPHKPQATGWE